MSISEIQQEVIEEFSQFEDWMDKYNYLIETGKNAPKIEDDDKTESNLIQGCQSRVWIQAAYRDGKVYYATDSDAVITKGIANLLIRVFSGQKPQDIVDANMDFLDKIGLREHLSPTRSNGLTAMIKQMKLYALAFKAKYEAS